MTQPTTTPTETISKKQMELDRDMFLDYTRESTGMITILKSAGIRSAQYITALIETQAENERLTKERDGWKLEADRLRDSCLKSDDAIAQHEPFMQVLRSIDNLFGCDHTPRGPEDCQHLIKHVRETKAERDAMQARVKELEAYQSDAGDRFNEVIKQRTELEARVLELENNAEKWKVRARDNECSSDVINSARRMFKERLGIDSTWFDDCVHNAIARCLNAEARVKELEAMRPTFVPKGEKCKLADCRINGGNIVCGTVNSPSSQVQDAMKRLAEERARAPKADKLSPVAAAEAALKLKEDTINAAMALLPELKSLVVHHCTDKNCGNRLCRFVHAVEAFMESFPAYPTQRPGIADDNDGMPVIEQPAVAELEKRVRELEEAAKPPKHSQALTGR